MEQQNELPGNQFDYNKEFDLNAWLQMRPSHISEAEWPIRLAELKLMLETNEGKKRPEFLILGWKSKNGLV